MCIRWPKQLRTLTTVITGSTSNYVQAARCQRCDTGVAEALEHFLLQCPSLQVVRGNLTPKLLGVC